MYMQYKCIEKQLSSFIICVYREKEWEREREMVFVTIIDIYCEYSLSVMYCSINQRKVTVHLHVCLSAIVYLVGAIEVGVAYLPFFACLSTPHRLLGGVLGLLYTLMWYMKTLSFLFVAVAVKTFVGCRTDC